MPVSLKQLRYFVTIAECGKIAQASKVLHLSQPALSSALAQLEESWGTQLFIRHKAQGMTLTASGELLQRHSRQLLQQAHTLDDYARGLNEQVAGEIRIGCFSTLGPLFIPALLQQAREHYPDLHIQVLECDLAKLEENLLNGQMELALSYGLERNHRIRHDPLADCPPYVLLPELHPLATAKKLSLHQLCHEPLVLLDLPHSGDYFLSLFAATGCQPPIAYRSRNFEMIRSMVAAGLGFSLLNQRPHTDQAYNGGKVKMIPLQSNQAQSLQIVIAQHVDLKPSVRAEVVMQLMRQIVRPNELPAGLQHRTVSTIPPAQA